MRGESIANNYAEALFELADRNGVLEAYGEALDLVAGLVDELPSLRQFLDTPRIDTARKKQVVRQAFGERIPVHVLNFLLLTLDKRRQRLVPEMAAAYRSLLDERLGRAHVEVTVARPVPDEERKALARHLSNILGKDAIPHVRVKPELIGGITFRSGDTIFDGSVRRRLQRMRHRLMAADVSTT